MAGRLTPAGFRSAATMFRFAALIGLCAILGPWSPRPDAPRGSPPVCRGLEVIHAARSGAQQGSRNVEEYAYHAVKTAKYRYDEMEFESRPVTDRITQQLELYTGFVAVGTVLSLGTFCWSGHCFDEKFLFSATRVSLRVEWLILSRH